MALDFLTTITVVVVVVMIIPMTSNAIDTNTAVIVATGVLVWVFPGAVEVLPGAAMQIKKGSKARVVSMTWKKWLKSHSSSLIESLPCD